MPQEFQVLQCYKCETFQVHQVKKTTKWQCKLCGEKQSLKKVFGRGTGSECRCHVQKLNTIRGELCTATITTSSSQFVTSASHQFDSRSHTTHRLDDDEEGTCQNGIQTQQSGNNKWNLFVDEDCNDSNGDDDGNYEDNMFTTDASLFKRGKKRKRMNKKSYGEYNHIQRPDQRKTDDLQDQSQKLSGQVNKFDYLEPSQNNRQSGRWGALDKYSTENQFNENNSLNTRQADTYNYNEEPNVNNSYRSSFNSNTSNLTNSASKWNNFVPVENSPETQEDENDLADTRQTEEIFKRASNVTNNFKNLGHDASSNSAPKWNNYTPAECSNKDDLHDHETADIRQKELNSFKAKSNNFDKLSSKASTNVSSKWNDFVSAANEDLDSENDEDSLHNYYHGNHDKNVLFSKKKSNFENFDIENVTKTVLTERQTMGNVGQLNTGFKNSSDVSQSSVALNVFERKAVESSVKNDAPKQSKWGSYVNTSKCEIVNKSAYYKYSSNKSAYYKYSSNKAAGLTFTAGDLTDEDFNL